MSTVIQIELPSGQVIDIDLAEEEFSWEIVETEERQMGIERCHEAVLPYESSEKEEPVTITLRVWEYPEGIVNHKEIEVEGAELLSDVEGCDLGSFVIGC